MLRSVLSLLVIVLIGWCAVGLAGFPEPEVPAGLGVNIHFGDHPQPGEVKMLVDGGFGMVRTGNGWAEIEKEKGKYDFAACDYEMDTWKQMGVRPLYLLCYGNKLYGDPMAASNEESRVAYAKWAAAVVKRYAGQGVVWEIWNEPNYKTFWPPEPNVSDYAKLALAASKAIHEVAPDETIIGPATSMVDLPFMEACFKAGLLEYWSGVSMHPYRRVGPEGVTDDYRKVRLLISRYAPAGKKVAIISSEWGYTNTWPGMTAELQGKMLARQWLVNMSCEVPVSIWYDWRNDSPNPADDESNFGTVGFIHHAGRDPVYDPKPAYTAAKTLAQTLRGYRFNKRLTLDSPDDWVLVFTKGQEVKLVVWTAVAGATRRVVIPAGAGRFGVMSHLGRKMADVQADANGLAIDLTDDPQYLTPETPNEYLGVLAAWTSLRSDAPIHAPVSFTPQMDVRNTTGRPIKFYTWADNSVVLAPGESHSAGTVFGVLPVFWPMRMRQQLHIEDFPIAYQDCILSVTNPLLVTALPSRDGKLPVRIENPAGEPFTGRVGATASLGQTGDGVEVKIAQGQTQVIVVLPAGDTKAAVGLKLSDEKGNTLIETAKQVYQAIPLDLNAYQLVADGDAKVTSEQSAKVVAAPPGLPTAGGKGEQAIQIDYRFEAGQKLIRLSSQGRKFEVSGQPAAMGIWVYSDRSGNAPRMRYVDASGQCFQVVADHLNGTGWRYIVYPFDGTYADHWGGANDGKLHYPLTLDTVFLVDNASQKPSKGTVYIAMPTMIWPAR